MLAEIVAVPFAAHPQPAEVVLLFNARELLTIVVVAVAVQPAASVTITV